MAHHENLEEKIDRALNSMDMHTRATPGPYFSTRINAKLQAPKVLNAWDKLYALITKPVVALAAVLLILVLNVLIISMNRNVDGVKFQADSTSEWQLYSTATTNALYDVENIEP